MTQFRDEFKTSGVEGVVWSQAEHVAQLLGLNPALNGIKHETRRVDVVLEVACGTRGVARVAKRTQLLFRAENEGATKKASQRFPAN